MQPERSTNDFELASLGDRRALQSALAGLPRSARVAVLLVDLNDFRSVNVDFGHAVGDELLRRVALRLHGVLRANDRCFHFGGDEFAVLIGELKTPQLAELAARKILTVIAQNLELAGSVFSMVANVGVALYPEHADTPAELFQAADVALNHARRQGCRFKIYDDALRETAKTRADLKGQLKLALNRNDLMLHYQPQIDLQRATVSGCEALVRWQHRERGWIRPDLFIPVAESSELIESLTYWSLNVALREWFERCRQCSTSVSVNLSAKLLHSQEIVAMVRQAVSIWGTPPGSLVLEVTESAMMSDPNAALNTLAALAEMGVTLSIDDFGTGYSSLAYLKKLPVAELKIDKSFVMNMAGHSHDRKIVQAVIDMAHNLDLKVVAEGIENRQALDMLIGMGCDYGQGYFIARPMEIAELPSWVEASDWRCQDD